MATEKKSKVKSISFSKEWKSQYGVTFYHDIEFENEDKGSIGLKTKDAIQVGEEVLYEIDGDKIKRKFESNFSPKNIGAKKEYDNIGAMIGNAITNAVNIYINGHCNYDEIEKTADDIIKISLNLKAKHSS